MMGSGTSAPMIDQVPELIQAKPGPWAGTATTAMSALGDAVGDNRYHVRLLRTGEVKEREVIIGARNDTDVAVVQGLEEGDEVIVGESASGAAK